MCFNIGQTVGTIFLMLMSLNWVILKSVHNCSKTLKCNFDIFKYVASCVRDHSMRHIEILAILACTIVSSSMIETKYTSMYIDDV